jgi:hypothetical protein
VTFTLIAEGPVVSAITPARGPTTGNTLVTLTGTGFRDGMTVRLGDVPCTPATVIDDTRVTCLTAAHLAGPVDATVAYDDLPFTLPGAYTYQATPTPTPTPTPTIGLYVTAQPTHDRLRAETFNRVVRQVRSNATEEVVQAHCRINGKRSLKVCRIRINHERGRVTVRPSCTSSVTVHVRVTARTSGVGRAVWRRSWKVAHRPEILCRTQGYG